MSKELLLFLPPLLSSAVELLVSRPLQHPALIVLCSNGAYRANTGVLGRCPIPSSPAVATAAVS